MHSHPNTVAVFLTDAKGTFTFPDGKKQDFAVKAGDAQYSAAGTHLPENTGDKDMEVIVTELKGKTAKAAAATKAAPGKATKK
jgi:mannose-6-phosphate isomerase-like protein (cupin superfamily)